MPAKWYKVGIVSPSFAPVLPFCFMMRLCPPSSIPAGDLVPTEHHAPDHRHS